MTSADYGCPRTGFVLGNPIGQPSSSARMRLLGPPRNMTAVHMFRLHNMLGCAGNAALYKHLLAADLNPPPPPIGGARNLGEVHQMDKEQTATVRHNKAKVRQQGHG
jgi:hypothetical protein